MANICELTGKRPMTGHKVSHANNKTKRRFYPNLKKVSLKSELLRKNVNLKIVYINEDISIFRSELKFNRPSCLIKNNLLPQDCVMVFNQYQVCATGQE